VDKTEILNLSVMNQTSTFNVKVDNTYYNLDAVKQLTICGITFSLDKEVELKMNVESKVSKLSDALKGWSKRSLSIFGRNLVLKTFGLSQIIYTMQNTLYPPDVIKKNPENMLRLHLEQKTR